MASIVRDAVIFVFLLCLFKSNLANGETEAAVKVTELIDGLVPKNYTKAVRPNFGEKPVKVEISMFILELSDISDKSMDFRAQMYLRHRWVDDRLTYSPDYGQDKVFPGEKITKKIWMPDTFFANAKSVTHQPNIMTGGHNEFCQISPNGTVFVSKMLNVVASCPMGYTYFPFDMQVCSLELESYGSSMADIEYHWISKGVGVSADIIGGSSFRLLGHKLSTKMEILSSGNYSRLVVSFWLERNFDPYLCQVYMPAFLLVVLSWIPLWLSATKHHIRVFMALLITLAFVFLSQYFKTLLPPTSYHKIVDCYLMASYIAILATLLECAVVAFLDMQTTYKAFHSDQVPKQVNIVDKWSRWIIPLVWLVFNIFYVIRVYNISYEM